MRMLKQVLSTESAIVARAARNLHLALASSEVIRLPESGARWLAYSKWAREEIPKLRSVHDVVAFAQLRYGFESRAVGLRHRWRFKQINKLLRREFPSFSEYIDTVSESSFSARKTCISRNGHLVSSQLLKLV